MFKNSKNKYLNLIKTINKIEQNLSKKLQNNRELAVTKLQILLFEFHRV